MVAGEVGEFPGDGGFGSVLGERFGGWVIGWRGRCRGTGLGFGLWAVGG